MPATIIVGGQLGSEGKGKVTSLTAARAQHPWVVRCGGPNSGHGVWVNDRPIVLRQLPVAAPQQNARLAIAAGCAVDEDLLLSEIKELCVSRDRLIVDPRAVLLDRADRESEDFLTSYIGSTGSGTGTAMARRLLRRGNARLAADSARLAEVASIDYVAPHLHAAIDRGEDVIVEGTQGFGLSLLHGPGYPYVTSRDTTASAFASEAGISPRDIGDIVLVIRTFPIRVGGNSGELRNEVTWDYIRENSNAPEVEYEFTSVTNRLRRVGLFDIEMVRNACRYNKPTKLAVMGIDRIDYENRGVRDGDKLTASAASFLGRLRIELGVPIEWVGTGFATTEAVCLQR
ncbi:MAG: adenylosuccinate synthetase [Isosphaeraceae bacterium]|nr:adenylosuccinate synthetase [Isosphaeraceae bacterium]